MAANMTEVDAGTLELSVALSRNPRTQALLDGQVAPPGVRLLGTALHGSEMFWRQLKFSEFDVSDMSLSSLIAATVRGGATEWVALPVFTMRMFFHTGVLVRTDAGIEKPIDLHGKRVGVPEYQQTAALWTRGILHDEFGVEPSKITWFMERPPEQSHGGATGFKPPPGVDLQYISRDTNIGEMLLNGELDATLLYLNTANLVDRSRADLSNTSVVRTLFADPKAEAHRFFAKTGIFPINHTIVVRRTLLEQRPSIALDLYEAFARAKAELAVEQDRLLDQFFSCGVLDEATRSALTRDPLAYGIRAARPVLETIARYSHEQGLTTRRIGLEEIFAPGTMEL
jgi:4,5-dihydroxyphthalate decarboxylase